MGASGLGGSLLIILCSRLFCRKSLKSQPCLQLYLIKVERPTGSLLCAAIQMRICNCVVPHTVCVCALTA